MRAREYHRSPGAVKRELFRLIVKKLKGDTGGLGFRHWKLFEEWATDPSRRRPLQLPRGVLAEKQGDLIRLCFARRPGKAKPVLIKSAHSGRVTFAGRTVRFQVRSYKPGRLSAVRTIQGGAVLDLDKIRFPIRIRTRQPGDRFIPLGMEGSKKLQDFLVDAKVPFQERDGVPIFADRKRIIWVGGLRPADPVKVTPRTRRVLKFWLCPNLKK